MCVSVLVVVARTVCACVQSLPWCKSNYFWCQCSLSTMWNPGDCPHAGSKHFYLLSLFSSPMFKFLLKDSNILKHIFVLQRGISRDLYCVELLDWVTDIAVFSDIHIFLCYIPSKPLIFLKYWMNYCHPSLSYHVKTSDVMQLYCCAVFLSSPNLSTI